MSWTRKIMIRGWLAVGCVASVVVANSATPSTADTMSRYRTIVDRNPFGLQPPKPQTAPEPLPDPPPKVQVYLTGLTSLLDPPRAYLMTKAEDGEVKYYSLAKDQKQDGLEVLDINLGQGTVRIKNSGSDSLLSFKTHGLTNLAQLEKKGAPRVAGRGSSGQRLPVPTRTTVASRVGVPGMGTSGRSSLPARVIRSAPSPTSPTASSRLAAIRQQQNQQRNPTPVPPNPYTPEEQILLLEAQKAASPDIEFPPTPPLLPGVVPDGQQAPPPASPPIPLQ